MINKTESSMKVISCNQVATGAVAYYRMHDLDYPVEILDIRRVWGRTDALITPVGGKGQRWIQADQLRVRNLEEK